MFPDDVQPSHISAYDYPFCVNVQEPVYIVEKSVFLIWVDLFLCRSIQLLVLSYAEMFVYMYLSQLMSTFTNYLKVHHLLDGFFIL